MFFDVLCLRVFSLSIRDFITLEACPQKRASTEDMCAPTVEQREAWREQSLSWTLSAEQKVKKSKKPDRLSSFSWIHELDHALLLTFGRGISFWSRLEPAENAPELGKLRAGPLEVLSISSDNGPDGYSARWFLKHKFKCMLLDFEDVAHGIHRDEEAAVNACRVLKERLYLNGIHFNLDWGPFGSGAWHQDLIEAAQAYFARADEHDPIFVHLLPRFAADMGMKHELEQPGFRKKAWHFFREQAMKPKGKRLQTSRFGSIVDVGISRMASWTARMAI